MVAEIITIGDEILIGQITNTNSQWMARELNLLGVKVGRMTSVGDTLDEIKNSLSEASNRANIILITGGLGPTSDDITKPALCEYFNTSLIFNEKIYANVDDFVSKRGGTMNELNKNQAMVPEAATILYNPIGTAAGLWFEKNNIVYVSMPGVPFEMEKMMTEQVLPAIKSKFKFPNIYHKTVLTAGIAESALAIKIESWENQLPNSIKLAYLPSPGMVKLRLSGYGNETIPEAVENEILKLQDQLGDTIFGFNNDTMESVLGTMLHKNNKTLAVAESCTGGNISKLITSISGSSAYFKGSIISYSNEVKEHQLQVPVELLQKYGAVSQQVAEEMALNVLKILNSDYSIATTGIAGPTGGSTEKPVGTVWISVASKKGVVSQKHLFSDNRDRNVARSSFTALNLLRLLLIQNKI
jgi:nicotinamide-nucleotide amidase